MRCPACGTRPDAHLLLLLVDDALLLDDDDEHLLAVGLRLRHHLLLLLELDRHLRHLLRRVRQLLQAVLQFRRLVADARPLLLQQLAVPLHQLEVVRRRHVVRPPQPREHRPRLGEDRRLCLREDGGHSVEVRLVDLHLLEEFDRHLLERLGGPLGEPVDRRARDERGEHPHVVAERLAHRRHAHDDVEAGAHDLDEPRPQVVVRLLQPRRLHRRPHRVADRAELVGREEVGHLARREHAVDVLEE